MSSLSIIEDPNSPELKLLFVFVFDVLISKLTKSKVKPEFPKIFQNQKFPVFVTWTKGKQQNLRGCIGTFLSDDLEENLKNFAISAAFKDSRFPPINEREIPSLNCGISLLINFEDAKNCYDWELGKHGIQIFFEDHGQHSATFLPEVPIEHNMNKETTLQNLIEKAGSNEKLKNIDKKILMRRYQSIKLFMTYEEYLKYKQKPNKDL
jgi:uncharacterized protein (TIGR00296 family)